MPTTPQKFVVPPGDTAQISIIDSTTSISNAATSLIIGPPIKGLDRLNNVPSWAFLIESPATGQKVLFDLGVPPDWREFSPVLAENLKKRDWVINAEKHVSQVLQEHDITLESINSIIWSHHHWDHLGDPSKFPRTTDLVVGPGFKEAFFPGWPERKDSPFRSSDFKGRNLREINFALESEETLLIGPFRAVDFFGDGSFYLLDTPGHAIGHVGGLVRTTTSPDTFIFLGGDLCHHNGEIRPSPYLALPKQIHLEKSRPPLTCPGSFIIENIQASRNRTANQPIFDPPPNMAFNMTDLKETLHKTQQVDAGENVLFINAHDKSIRGVVDFFPKSANEWAKRGWKEDLCWKFLEEFPEVVSSYSQH